MANDDPAVRTRTLARVVGPYLVLTAVMLYVRRAELPTLLPSFMKDAPLVLATGAFTLMAGLVIVAAGRRWTSAGAVVIALIGVAAALKGAWLLIAPDLAGDMTVTVLRMPSVLMIAAASELLVGLWLSWVGWLSKA